MAKSSGGTGRISRREAREIAEKFAKDGSEAALFRAAVSRLSLNERQTRTIARTANAIREIDRGTGRSAALAEAIQYHTLGGVGRILQDRRYDDTLLKDRARRIQDALNG